jgi:hypothetical protein
MKLWWNDLKQKRDWLIYRLFSSTVIRVDRKSPGMAYMAYLTAKDYTQRHPPTLEVRESADRFFESLPKVWDSEEYV